MKYIIALTLVFVSFSVSAQDVLNKLANASHRKWIGANIYDDGARENTGTLTFYTNHKLVIGDHKYNTTKPDQKWWLASGEFITDRDIVLKLGNRLYQVEFSTTNNGRDFMTLTRIPVNEDESPVIKTYYAAD